MATLNIGGTKIKVGDEFLRMTPEQQSAAVEEIAAQLPGAAQQPGNAAPSPVMDEALATASAASRFGSGPVTPRDAAPGRPDLLGATAATLGGLVNGIPIVGPMAQNASDALVGAGAQLTGGDYSQTVEDLRARRAQLAEANPIANVAGNLAGGIGAMGGVGATKVGAEALGLTGNLGARILNSGVSGSLISAADTSVRGASPEDVAMSGGIGAGIGAAIPGIGAGIGAVTRALGNKVLPAINAVRRPAQEAERQFGVALKRDASAGDVMTAADEVAARAGNVPLLNADRGGETVRALTRSVANQSPEARGAIDRVTSDRFGNQAPRAVQFVKNLTGGSVDDLGLQERLRATARLTNKPRYDRAFNDPKAAAVWSPEIRQLMQSDLFKTAIRQAESTATDAAAIGGVRAVKNPFVFNADGSVGLRAMPDGSRALPTLQFWDQVKRNLDSMIGRAQRAGDNPQAATLTQMKTQLLNTMDGQVPSYRDARAGAAAFFGAEDALDAGRKFTTQTTQIPEAKKAFAKFNDAEKQAFATGYASELIDRMNAVSDRQNVIQRFFGSPASREMNELVFGTAKARQLEAYVRVEGLADRLRGALGNSTTARQLVELGLGAGGGFALSGGDWTGALGGALLAKGSRYAGEKVNAKVMESLAKLLTSNDPADIQRAVANATMSDQWMAALERFEAMIGTAARGTGVQIASGASGRN